MTIPAYPALAAADLPLTCALAGTSVAYPRFLQLLNDCIAKGAVANVDHVELKQHFGRLLETLWEKHVSAPYFYGQADRRTTPRELDDFYYGDSAALHRVEATLRKLSACEVDHPAVGAMRRVLTEFVPVAQRITHLKECIVKRVVKSPVEREAEQRFVPTRAIPAATRYVWEVLTEVTERNHQQLIEHLTREHAKKSRPVHGVWPSCASKAAAPLREPRCG